jgi:3-hydroxyacyl-CoA dehydrogenase
MQVSFEIKDGIAVLTIDRPPVNALSHELRNLIVARLEQISEDRSLRGLVLACAGRTFITGADIGELGQINPPMLRDVIDQLESLNIPSVAALHGTALGGGLELALGCTFRVADPKTRIGLPEVKLGLLPGAGGTVRTTYLAGAEATLKLAGSGEMLDAAAAKDLGLIDAVITTDLIDGAVRFLSERIIARDIPPPVAQRRMWLTAPAPGVLDRLEADLCRKARSAAPSAVAKAVRAAVDHPFSEAMQIERRSTTARSAKCRRHWRRHDGSWDRHGFREQRIRCGREGDGRRRAGSGHGADRVHLRNLGRARVADPGRC